MSLEIERKFLLAGEDWRQLAAAEYYCQGYLCSGKDCVVRVRIAGGKANITIKGPTVGASRLEYEYPIPLEDAQALLAELAEKPLIEKFRYSIPYKGMLWEVDEFLGINRGLVLAEVELEHEEQLFEKPTWIGHEVTGDPRYYNANLVRNPYLHWAKPDI